MSTKVIASGIAKRNNLVFIFTLFFVFSNLGCQKSDRASVRSREGNTLESILPEQSVQLGKAFAQRIKERIHKYPTILHGDTSNVALDLAPLNTNMQTFNSNSFTPNQWKLVAKLAKSFSESTSHAEMSERHREIALDVSKVLPGEEQEKIYNILAVAFFGIQEIQALYESQAGSTASELPLGVSGLNSRTGYLTAQEFAQIWLIAVSEPTPFGEIAAFMITVGYAVWFVMSRDDCIEEFVDCVPSSYNYCGTCLQYCIVQGTWNCN